MTPHSLGTTATQPGPHGHTATQCQNRIAILCNKGQSGKSVNIPLNSRHAKAVYKLVQVHAQTSSVTRIGI